MKVRLLPRSARTDSSDLGTRVSLAPHQGHAGQERSGLGEAALADPRLVGLGAAAAARADGVTVGLPATGSGRDGRAARERHIPSRWPALAESAPPDTRPAVGEGGSPFEPGRVGLNVRLPGTYLRGGRSQTSSAHAGQSPGRSPSKRWRYITNRSDGMPHKAVALEPGRACSRPPSSPTTQAAGQAGGSSAASALSTTDRG